jgi:hypothetical protein
MLSKLTMTVLATAMLASAIAAIAIAVLTTAPAFAHVEQVSPGAAGTELTFAQVRDQRIINEVVVNGMVTGTDPQPTFETWRDPDTGWPN